MNNFDPACWNRAFNLPLPSSSPHSRPISSQIPITSANPIRGQDRQSKSSPILKGPVNVRGVSNQASAPACDRFWRAAGRSAGRLFGSVWQHPWNQTHHNNAAPIRSTESASPSPRSSLQPWNGSITKRRPPERRSSQTHLIACPSAQVPSSLVQELVSRSSARPLALQSQWSPTGNHPRASQSLQRRSRPDCGRHLP